MLKELVLSQLKNYDLEGVEITEEDITEINQLSETHSLDESIHRILTGIRDTLDEGLGM